MSKCGRETDVVTGAFGFTGQHITRRLLALGRGARTLTGHPNRPNPFGDRISVAPFNFDHPRELTNSLRGATTLYNTYWIRFPYGQLTFGRAVENTRTLIKAAEEAGLRRIVHISITNAAEDSPFPYFRGKAMVEKAIVQSRLSHAIIRPSVIFGTEGILINNIAWLLRRLPVFAVPGSGDYRLQPVFVEDLAEIAVDAGLRGDNIAVDAVGPETAPFNALVRLIADTVHSRAKIIHLSPVLVLLLVRALGNLVNDVVLTRDEIEGLMANLLVSSGPPTGHTRLSTWLAQNADQVGTRYLSELRRHYR
ncbi:MAG: NAD(P)H-binding protein [Chloroflexi bacterium]|nr:NAD(P)H-binding protein [Chloroflexota bacterium]